MAVIRSVLAILAGLFVITLISESIEFVIVTVFNGGIETDQDRYFALRNRTSILVAKLFYNSLGAFAGGWAAAWVAGRSPVAHGAALAAIQAALFVWGMTLSSFAGTTPLWNWLLLTVLMTVCIIWGAGRRR